MPRTTSRISHNLPEFPYSPAIAGRRHFSALLSSSHFVTTFVSTRTDSHHYSSSSSSAAQTAPSSPASDPPPSFRLPPQEHTEFFSTHASPLPSSPSSQISPQPSQPPPDCSALIEPLVKPAPPRAESSKRRGPRPSSSVKAPGIARSSNLSPSPIIVLGEPSLVQTVTVGTNITSRRSRCKSSWRSLKRMGNRLVTPFRSMGLCMTGGWCAMAFFDDLSTDGSSSRSSWCSTGEISPDFIRAVLENNVLLGHLTVD